jgi:hypothetical protein
MKRKKGKPTPPAVLSRGDKWKIIAVLAGAFVTLLCGGLIGAKSKHSQKIESRLARWRTTYHLDDEQVRKVCSLETQFHAGWNPFHHPVHTPAEIYQHHLTISRVMTPEDAASFLKSQEGARSAADPSH